MTRTVDEINEDLALNEELTRKAMSGRSALFAELHEAYAERHGVRMGVKAVLSDYKKTWHSDPCDQVCQVTVISNQRVGFVPDTKRGQPGHWKYRTFRNFSDFGKTWRLLETER